MVDWWGDGLAMEEDIVMLFIYRENRFVSLLYVLSGIERARRRVVPKGGT